MPIKHIIVVCTANICRSPMAAALIRARLALEGRAAEIDVTSAGIFALEGEAASAPVVELLAARGIDVANHRASSLSPAALDEADLILVMAERHRQSIFNRSPQDLHKVFLLSELVGRSGDIDDPYGGPRAGYEKTLQEIESILDQGWHEFLMRLGLPADGRLSA